MKKHPFILALAAVVGLTTGGLAAVHDAQPADAYVIGYHYEYNRTYNKCWRIDHVQTTAWQFMTGQYVNVTRYAVPVGQYCPWAGTWV